MKKLFWLFVTFVGLSFAACSEESEENEFEGNWEERNVAYIDSIATVARANQGAEEEKWQIIQSYHLSSLYSSTNNQDYVFAKILKKGTGTVRPLYTDSVSVNYRGRLIPTASYPQGYIFDQNYYGDMDEDNMQIMVPSDFALNSVVDGWTTALQEMREGDIWRLYIPQNLGYGSSNSSNTSIPAYSTLIFDVYLRSVKHK